MYAESAIYMKGIPYYLQRTLKFLNCLVKIFLTEVLVYGW